MAFLGISIPTHFGKILNEIEVPGEKEDTSKYHITLFYFGKNWPLSVAAQTMEALFELLSYVKPFSVQVNKISCFPQRENESVPIIAKIESKELHQLQQKIKHLFDKKEIEYDQTFKDYKPHITLAYAKKEIEDIEIEKISIFIPEITLYPCDHEENRLFINFSLNGDMQEKQSHFLLQKSNFFSKLAEVLPSRHDIPGSDREIKKIPIFYTSKIKISPTGMRPNSLDYVRTQRQRHDMMKPVVIEVYQGSEPFLADGRHRLTVARELGDKSLQAIVRYYDNSGATIKEELGTLIIDN